MRNKIAFIIGTRAELIKSFPLMLELQREKKDYYFIHTGQHALGNLSEIFGVKKPDFVLTKEPDKESKFWSKINHVSLLWMSEVILKVKLKLRTLKEVGYVVYHGDTMTTTAAAIGSSKLFNPFKKYKNVHLEGGLRSGSLREPFPEEISRKIADHFSDIILAVSERCNKNLKNHKGKQICLTGNSVIDSINYSYALAKKKGVKTLAKGRYALISVHRHENINNRKRMENLAEILSSLKVKSFWTLHENTKKQLEKFGLLEGIIKNKNIHIIPTQDYVSFTMQIKNASLIICDGGSMQEESLVFHIPCVLLRNKTERQEGLESNFQSLVGTRVKEAKEEIEKYLSKDFKVKKIKNPYGKEGVSKKILGILK
jgi:UDP-N-acetylglucosamine 2-epimerase